jgi:prolyl-tRNA synthetase
MAHSDDQGLILPPRIAPIQVVIVPIYKGADSQPILDEKANQLMAELKAKGISVKYDNNDNARPGWKFAEYELKGVPVRIAMGMRDLENGVVELARRDTKEKQSVPMQGLSEYVQQLLEDIQQSMFQRALQFRDANIRRVDTWDEFVRVLDTEAGFISAHWDGSAETEEKIKELTKATIRCIPLDNPEETGSCILSGKLSNQRVLFARAY